MKENSTLTVLTIMYAGEDELMESCCEQKDGIIFPVKVFHTPDFVAGALGKELLILEAGFGAVSWRAIIKDMLPLNTPALLDKNKFHPLTTHKMFLILDGMRSVPPRSICYPNEGIIAASTGEIHRNAQAGCYMVYVDNAILQN